MIEVSHLGLRTQQSFIPSTLTSYEPALTTSYYQNTSLATSDSTTSLWSININIYVIGMSIS